MIRRIALLCLLFTLAAACAGEGESTISVSVVGLRVTRPNPLNERLIWPGGTTIALQVTSTARELIRFDAADSTIMKFVDDKGTDLQTRSKDPAEKQLPAGYGHTPKIANDAKACLIEATAPNLPAKGAAQIELQGMITMLCATSKKETEIKNVAIRSGTKIAGPGNLELQFEQVGKPDYGKGEWGLLLRAQRELDELAEVKFFRADGTEIPSVRTTTSTLAIEGAVRVEWNYLLSERTDAATVKLYTWSDANKRRVKFDLKVDLGL